MINMSQYLPVYFTEVDLKSLYNNAQAQSEALWAKMEKGVSVLSSTARDQLGKVKGLALHLKAGVLWTKFAELGKCVPMGMEDFAKSLKGASAYVGGFAATGAIVDTVELIYNKIFGFTNKKGEIIPESGLVELKTTEDQIGRVLSVAGLVAYLHSRIFLAANCFENALQVPAFQGLTKLASDPTMTGLMIGGVSQTAVAAVRIISAGTIFSKEKDSKVSETANKVKDWFLAGEGLSMVAEAGVVMFGVTNPWAIPACQAAGLSFKLLQVWLVPVVSAYCPTPKTVKTNNEKKE